jgi:hypothetical protein
MAISDELTTVYGRVCSKKNEPEEREKIKNYIERKYNVSIG